MSGVGGRILVSATGSRRGLSLRRSRWRILRRLGIDLWSTLQLPTIRCRQNRLEMMRFRQKERWVEPREEETTPLSVHFAEESTKKIPLSTIPIQSLSIFNRRATACISSFELADLSAYNSTTPIDKSSDGIGHTREPTREEIKFVEDKLRDEVIFVEKVIADAIGKSRVGYLMVSDESRTYFEGMNMVSGSS